jgi:hypothetical protein
MLIGLGCLFIVLLAALLGKWAGSLADAWTLVQQSPGKALYFTAFALLLLLCAAAVPFGLMLLIYAWWSFALVVVSRFYVLLGLPLASVEGLPTFYYRRYRDRYTSDWVKEYVVNHIEVGGKRFRLDDFVSSKLPQGHEPVYQSYQRWVQRWIQPSSESDCRGAKRITLPFRAWYVPSTRLLVSIEWPVWAERRKLDLLEQSYAALLHPPVNTPRPQTRLREYLEFYHKLKPLRAGLRDVPEESREQAEEQLDLLAFFMEWGADALKKGPHK